MDTIGFIGLGSLGAPMAGRLADAGLAPAVFDIEPEAVRRVTARGAVARESAREVGDAADIVFFCLPRPEVSAEVAAQLRGTKRCSALVEMSTVGRAALARIREALGTDIALLDCPVSGGVPKAERGDLSAIVAGDPALIERVRPVLEHMAARIFVVGAEPGLAQVCKLVNNAISITGLVVACEAVAMGVKAGVDAGTLIDVINASTGRNSATVDKFPRAILPRTFDYGGPLSIGTKDLNLYLEETLAQGTPGFAVSNAAQLWAQAERRFGADADMTMFFRLLEEWAGLAGRERAGDG